MSSRAASDQPVDTASQSQRLKLNGETVQLLGEVNVENVRNYRDDLFDLIKTHGCSLTLDMSVCTIEGSTILALLIGVHRFSHLEKKPIKIVDAPEKLIGMSRLNGIFNFLPFE